MNPLVRASTIAAAIGTVPPLVFVVLSSSGIGPIEGLDFLAFLCVLLCPPWQVFWAGIGEPHNVVLWTKLSAIVIASNALLYVPLGMTYALTSSRRPMVRGALVVGVFAISLCVGHLIFVFLV
jgi:hypothetical protein